MNLREWSEYEGDMQEMNLGEVRDVIFLWFFLSNRKFGVEITVGMGSVQLVFFRSINILEKEGRETENSE